MLGDLLAHCPACGYESGVRNYIPTPFHTLTVARLRILLDGLTERMEGVCPQCEAVLDSGSVQATMLHYGFPSGIGIIRGLSSAGETSWLLCPHDEFDVQEVPQWDAAADSSRVECATLTEEEVWRVFGRPLSPKQAARDWLITGQSGVLDCGPGLRLVRGQHEDEASVAAIAAENSVVDGPWSAVLLSDGDKRLSGFFGAPDGWLARIETGSDKLWGCAAQGPLAGTIERIVKQFPIEIELVREPDTLAMILPASDGPEGRPTFEIAEISIESARSMSYPPDVARLEIDRLLHALTGLWVVTGEEA